MNPHSLDASQLTCSDHKFRREISRRASPIPGAQYPSYLSQRSSTSLFEKPLIITEQRKDLDNAHSHGDELRHGSVKAKVSQWVFGKANKSTSRQASSLLQDKDMISVTVGGENLHKACASTSLPSEISTPNRHRYRVKNAFTPNFEEHSQRSPVDSWYHDSSSAQNSPVGCETADEDECDMKTRDFSNSAQRNFAAFNPSSSDRPRGKATLDFYWSDANHSTPIHPRSIESKSEDMEESHFLRDTGSSADHEVQNLALENGRLHRAMAQLEYGFEQRVRKIIEHKMEAEASLRRKMKQLEDKVGCKDRIIRDLEHRDENPQRDFSGIEAYKIAVEKLEYDKKALEETSRNLEKRNDILAGLLGQFPSRSNDELDLLSSVKDETNGTPRPRSLVSRIPSSPTRNTIIRPSSYQARPSYFQHRHLSSNSALYQEQTTKLRISNKHIALEGNLDDNKSMDSGLGDSCSVDSTNDEAVSKRCSLLLSENSYPGDDPLDWEVPLPPSSSDNIAEALNRKRKTRRFAPGSTQLKPLVLPSLRAPKFAPEGCCWSDASSSSDRRNTAEELMRPSISSVSQPEEIYAQSRYKSKTVVQEPWSEDLLGRHEQGFTCLEEALNKNSVPAAPVTLVKITDHPFLPGVRREFKKSPPALAMNWASNIRLSSDGLADIGEKLIPDVSLNLPVTKSRTDTVRAADPPCTGKGNHGEARCAPSIHTPRSFEPHHLFDHANQYQIVPGANVNEVKFLDQSEIPTLRYGSSLSNSPTPPDLPVNSRAWTIISRRPEDRGEARGDDGETLSSPMHSLVDQGIRSVEECVKGVNPRVESAGSTRNSLDTTRCLSDHRSNAEAHTPPRMLHRNYVPDIARTSVTNTASFGVFSGYAHRVREIRDCSTAIARRMIANVWCKNSKQFSYLAWWVLGLFIRTDWNRDFLYRNQQLER